MRARRLGELCGLTLAVAAGHWAAWRLAVAEAPRAAPVRPGVRRVAWIAPVRPPAPPPGPAAHGPPAPPPSRPRRPPRPAAGTAPARMPPTRSAPPGDAPAGVARLEATQRPAPGPSPAPARGEAGAARVRRSDDAHPWPVYPTRPPPAATLRYALAVVLPPAGWRPAALEGGRATIAWARGDGGFSLRLATRPEGRAEREWISTGGFDAAGVAPRRLAEREGGRDRRVVEFEPAAGRVRFSSAPGERATAPGVQDRWSWIAQLAAIAQAQAPGARPVPPGTRWTLQVAGLRGDLDRWEFRVLEAGDVPVAGLPAAARVPPLLHVLRAPERPYDLRVEAWLAPALHHWPALLRLSTPPSAWAMSLALVDDEPAPPGAPNAP